MRYIIPALAAVVIATAGASSAARAALVDFGVAALGGTITYSGGATLDKSSLVDLDDALLIVTTIGAGDDSGLSVFPGGTDDTVTLTHPIDFGTGTGIVNTPIIGGDIFKTWTGLVNGVSDSFTETLSNVVEIDRGTANAITVTLSGTLSDSLNMFTNTPAHLILGVNEVGGAGRRDQRCDHEHSVGHEHSRARDLADDGPRLCRPWLRGCPQELKGPVGARRLIRRSIIGSIKGSPSGGPFFMPASRRPYSGVGAGSARRCSRSAAATAKRNNSARRLPGAMRLSSASRRISAP